ncbi:hypothetical protein Adeh_3221 [Anaeromyxobacter dehalogenans 2CP-C]|uniref:Uncharacterized protein n=1 Tax=Anaeromyxobacter dehalogenans (strain 2CP-C) TaxID=290397 RepID=Q2IEI1_ANADE|nr:hypothetical protein Adeh_3221 [Anaeromyxobacter dehalogenans 2CP-C]
MAPDARRRRSRLLGATPSAKPPDSFKTRRALRPDHLARSTRGAVPVFAKEFGEIAALQVPRLPEMSHGADRLTAKRALVDRTRAGHYDVARDRRESPGRGARRVRSRRRGVGLIGLGGQVEYATDFTVRAALPNSAGLTRGCRGPLRCRPTGRPAAETTEPGPR